MDRVLAPARTRVWFLDRVTSSTSTRTRLLVGGIFLLGLGLRLYSLDFHGFWRDEIVSLEVARSGMDAVFNYRFGWLANQTPLHYLLVWLTTQPVDPAVSTIFARLPSALAGALTPLAVYGIGRELFGRAQGLLAAILVALSTVHLSYSQDLRLYAMLTFLTAASVYCLLVAERTNSWRWWLGFTSLAVANLLNAFVALTLVTPVLLLYLAWALWRAWRRRSEDYKPLLYASLAMAVVCVACSLMLWGMLQSPRPAASPGQFSLVSTVTTAAQLVPWLLQWFTQFGVGGELERAFTLVFITVASLGLYVAVRRGQNKGGVLCALFILIGPVVFAFALVSNSYVIGQRYAIFAMPFYFLLISNGLLSPFFGAMAPGVQARVGRALKSIALCLVAVAISLFAWGAYNYNSLDHSQSLTYRPDYRQASQYLSQHATQDDTIIFVGWDGMVSDFLLERFTPRDCV